MYLKQSRLVKIGITGNTTGLRVAWSNEDQVDGVSIVWTRSVYRAHFPLHYCRPKSWAPNAHQSSVYCLFRGVMVFDLRWSPKRFTTTVVPKRFFTRRWWPTARKRAFSSAKPWRSDLRQEQCGTHVRAAHTSWFHSHRRVLIAYVPG